VVFLLNGIEHGLNIAGQALLAVTLLKVDQAAAAEYRVDEPGVDAEELGKFRGNIPVMGKMVRLQTITPAECERRDHRLAEVFQDRRASGGQIVVEQHETRLKVGYP
jgi:hypothetical protein